MKLAEVAEQLGKIVEHHRPKSTQPNYVSEEMDVRIFVLFDKPFVEYVSVEFVI